MHATMRVSLRRWASATAALCLQSATPAAAGVFGWTLSGSDTSPFVNVASSQIGATPVHLWLVCDNTTAGLGSAIFGVSSSLPVVSFTPAAGFTNEGTPTALEITATGCPTGPVRVGQFSVVDLGLGFSVCFVPSTGQNVSVDCNGATHENSFVGFVAGSGSPCGNVVSLCDAADLEVTTGSSAIAPPELVPFTLSVDLANHGPNAASLISVDAPLPAGLTYESHTASSGTWSSGTGVWFVGSLAAAGSASLSITAHADGGTTGSEIAFVATESSSAPGDPAPSNDADSTSLFIGQSQFTQLLVTKTAGVGTIAEGDTVLFHVSVTNVGTVDADSLTVVDVLPTGLTYAEHTAGAGTFVPGSGTWKLPAVVASDSVALDLKAVAAPGTGGSTLTNRAFLLQADPPDTTGADNADSASVDVTPPPATDLELRFVGGAPTVRELEPFTVAIRVRNLGSLDATGVSVQRAWPSGVTMSSSVASRGTVDDSSGVWSLGSLAAADSAILTMDAHPDLGVAGSIVSFGGEILGGAPTDTSAANDLDSVAVSVTDFLQATLPDVTAFPGQDMPISVLLDAPIQVDSTTFFVRAADAPSFASAPMTETQAGQWDVTIPGTSVAAVGTYYYCMVHAGENVARLPGSGFGNVNVRLNDQLVFSIPGGRYALLGSPVRPDAGATLTSLFDELGPYDRRGWRYGVWDGTRYADGPDEAPVPEPGRGFWIWLRDSAEIRWDGTAPNLATDPVVALHPGWNQVSSPLAVAVPFASVARPSDVDGDLVGYDGGGYTHFSPTFVPGSAYWIHNSASATRYLTFSVTPPASAAPQLRRTEGTSWSVGIDLDGGATRDVGNRIGMGTDALAGRDEWDVLEAPHPPGTFVSLAFVDGADPLHEDYRPASPDGDVWTMRIAWGAADTRYRLAFDDLESLPAEWGVTLLPATGGPPVAIEPNRRWLDGTTSATTSAMEWTALVGTRSFRDERRALVEAGWSARLDRPTLLVSPNPLRRDVRAADVTLAVPAPGRFSVAVYDVRGRLVTTLHEGALPAGVHRFRWDATDARGRAAAAGVYFLTMRTGEVADHRKLILLR